MASANETWEKRLQDAGATPVSLPLEFLKAITYDFAAERELGSGGYGVVYKGVLPSGKIIAVKKFFDLHKLGDEKFLTEVNSLMGIKHQNVVQFVGYCAESTFEVIGPQGSRKYILAEIPKRLLCFEHVCNKSLDKYISDESSGLEWNMRFEIIRGICGGLHYLHEECHIVHLDLKPQNILMDATMMPKIADFGLSRIFGVAQSRIITQNRLGTLGYMAPEYMFQGVVSIKADIYSLGAIIIEILTGSKYYPLSEDYSSESTKTSIQHFKDKILENWRNRLQKSQGDTVLLEQIRVCVELGIQCIAFNPGQRPVTKHMIRRLDNVSIMDGSTKTGVGSTSAVAQAGEASDTLQQGDPRSEGKSSLDIVPQTSYPHVQSPTSSPVQPRGDWSVLGNKNHQVIPSEVPARNIDHDYKGRTTLSSSNQFRKDVSAQASQRDSHAVQFDFDTQSQNPPLKGLSRSYVLDGSVGAEDQHAQEPSAQWGSGDSPNLASGLEEAKPSYPYLPTVPKEPGSSFSEAAEDDPLPGIEGLRIMGEAFPGRELQASGYSTNRTTSCSFEWVRHLEDGSVKFVEGARQPNYLVTADDVDSLLAVVVQPLDDRKRKGDIVMVHANEQAKITCDPQTMELIKKTLEVGHVSYQVQLPQVGFLDIWEPAVLVIKREGYSIKCNGQRGVVLTEKFQQATAINIPYGYERATEFSIVSADGAEYTLQPAENKLSRDTIVLVLRSFKSSSFSEATEDDPLPGIDGLRITGEACPGQKIQVSGFSTNGTTSCNFEWVRHLDDGSVKFIEGARHHNYLVTADDVGSFGT